MFLRFWRQRRGEDVSGAGKRSGAGHDNEALTEEEKERKRLVVIRDHVLAIRRLSIAEQVSVSISLLASITNEISEDCRSNFLLEINTKVLYTIRQANAVRKELGNVDFKVEPSLDDG